MALANDIRNAAILELLWHLFMYGMATSLHTRTTAPQYSKTFRKRSNLPLIIHIASGLSEVFRYQFRHVLAAGGPVVPNIVDLVLALAHSWSVALLTKTLLRGHRSLTRPSYLAGAVLRSIVSVIAFATSSPELHRGSVKIINGFIYTRAIIALACRFDLTRCYSAMYAAGVFLAGVLSTYESGLPAAMPAYMALTPALAVLNRLVSAELANAPSMSPGSGGSLRARILGLLVAAGVAELDTIKAVEQTSAISSSIKDDYIEEEADPAKPWAEPPPSPVAERMQKIKKTVCARMAKKECTVDAPFSWPSLADDGKITLLRSRRHSVPARVFSAL